MKPLDVTTFPLSGNKLIEASAGTGKTYTITNLYLRLLLGQGSFTDRPLTVSEILVLTFTVAATQELRSRIRERIFAARRAYADPSGAADRFLVHLVRSSADPARDAKLLTGALQLLDEASIFTIHGFCARVLGDNAFETGTLFDQNLDADRDVLLQTATEDCFRGTILTLPDFTRALALSVFPSPDELLKKLKPFLFRYNLTYLPGVMPVDGDLQQLPDDIRAAKEGWLRHDLPSLIENAGAAKNRKSYTRLAAMTEFCASDDLLTDLWEHWSHEVLRKNLRKGCEPPKHPVLDRIDRIWAQHDAVRQAQANLWHLVTQAVKDHLARYKVELAQLTLDDLLTRVHEAVTDPGSGGWLADTLTARWPVAMIDEFQDTDDVQYEIFDAIYRRDGPHALFFIGDPKQAIYQFRGADVFTYINAKRQVDPDRSIFSLDTNWRSGTALVHAVNSLFDQEGIFGNDADIPFEPVAPSPDADDKTFTRGGQPVKPVALVQFESSDGAGLNKDPARRLAMNFAAQQVTELLAAGQRGDALIDGRGVTAGDVAFLVRDKRDARAAREALAVRGVKSVYVTLESVFLTETADDLKVILEAVLAPTNERAIRAALAVPLMQSTASEIAAMSHDVIAQQKLLAEFMEYHRLWAELDVAPMIERLVQRRRIAHKWFNQPDGERQMTNLRHLAELLQQRSAAAPGMHRLLQWFTREKLAAETVAVEARQLRLESDRNLVQIVTMHASKGLEYNVVVIPMAGFVALEQKDEPRLFHEDEQGRFRCYLDFGDDDDHRNRAREESLAEDMRLLYVAVTRARYHLTIGIPDTGELPRSALAKLLALPGKDPDAIDAHLRDSLPGELFDISRVTEASATRFERPGDRQALVEPAPRPSIVDTWRLHSYTGMTRLIDAMTAREAPAGTNVIPGFADDEPASESTPAPAGDRFAFPRGPRAGVALHSLFENLDFMRPVPEQQGLIAQCVDRVGLTRDRDHWIDALTLWTRDILDAELPAGCPLSAIGRAKRLDEMEFHFPLATSGRLVTLLVEHGYLDKGTRLDVGELRGMMNGLIDLVFEHAGRFYLVDYKSNWLGNRLIDYRAEQLVEAIRHHRYDLQYLIYCVALNRYLDVRIPGYAYDSHFGGVCYLFLRGMTAGEDSGVFFDKPDADLIRKLDRELTAS